MRVLVSKVELKDLMPFGFEHHYQAPCTDKYCDGDCSYHDGYDYYSKSFNWKHGSGSFEVWANSNARKISQTFAFCGPSELCKNARNEFDAFLAKLLENDLVEYITEERCKEIEGDSDNNGY